MEINWNHKHILNIKAGKRRKRKSKEQMEHKETTSEMVDFNTNVNNYIKYKLLNHSG